MKGINQMMPYYGGKRRLAPKYPKPEYPLIIEPFAGGAGYSHLYSDRWIYLYDLDANTAAAWEWLINATAEDIEALPQLFTKGDRMPDSVTGGARVVLGAWLRPGSAGSVPVTRGSLERSWSPAIVERLKRQLPAIRHWKMWRSSYERIPNNRATWFVDPPYQDKGSYYRHSSKDIDFDHLAQWCLSRKGQVIVCENEGANWLPFVPFCDLVGGYDPSKGANRKSKEVVCYIQDGEIT